MHGQDEINATGSDEFFTCVTRLEGKCKFSYRLQYCLQLKTFTVPRVACKEKADPCKSLAVQKFVKGVIVLTRVGTFSIILIIDRSRTPGRLQPLGFFLFTAWCSRERIDISYMGGYSIKLCSERLRPEVQSLTLIYTIFDKRYPFRVFSIEKLYPFHISAS